MYQTSDRSGAPQGHRSCQLDVIWDEGRQEHPGIPKGWEQGTAGTCLTPQGTSPQRIQLKAAQLQIKCEIATLTEDRGIFSPTLHLKAQSIKLMLLSRVLGISKDGGATVLPSSTFFQCLTTLNLIFFPLYLIRISHLLTWTCCLLSHTSKTSLTKNSPSQSGFPAQELLPWTC